ncbi:FAD-binding protein [Cellulomonas sp. WB94]|uniref:FAD-binding protein n=1 Tax=Cellulomonas sp. WB94 TaxID=2173174 RepID=UPI0024131A01|nr:FAD-binding protein [Cellulomonas sp. WB94]
MPVAVRGGGHSTWESLPGAVVVDLRALHEVELDDSARALQDGTRLVHVGGGATWGEVAEQLSRHGLAISSGDTRSVGVGGLTLGGGIGWVVRGWGLALDQLVSAQLVTAAGEVLEISASSLPELFWGVRGGGGNLGVVTRFDFIAHPLAEVVHANVQLDPSDLGVLVRAFRDLMRQAPREMNGSLVRTPQIGPQMPSRTMIELAWASSDEAAARQALAPFLALPQVTHSEVSATRYLDLLQEPPMPPPDIPMPMIIDQNGWFASRGGGAGQRFRRGRGRTVHGALARRGVQRRGPGRHRYRVPRRRGVRGNCRVRHAGGIGGRCRGAAIRTPAGRELVRGRLRQLLELGGTRAHGTDVPAGNPDPAARTQARVGPRQPLRPEPQRR